MSYCHGIKINWNDQQIFLLRDVSGLFVITGLWHHTLFFLSKTVLIWPILVTSGRTQKPDRDKKKTNLSQPETLVTPDKTSSIFTIYKFCFFLFPLLNILFKDNVTNQFISTSVTLQSHECVILLFHFHDNLFWSG